MVQGPKVVEGHELKARSHPQGLGITGNIKGGQQGYPGDIRGGQNKNRKRGYKSLGRTSGDTRGDQRAGLRPLEDLALRDPRGPWGKPALLVRKCKKGK